MLSTSNEVRPYAAAADHSLTLSDEDHDGRSPALLDVPISEKSSFSGVHMTRKSIAQIQISGIMTISLSSMRMNAYLMAQNKAQGML